MILIRSIMGEHPHHHGDRLSATLSIPMSNADGSNQELWDPPPSRKQQHAVADVVNDQEECAEAESQNSSRASRRQSYPAPRKKNRSKSSEDLSEMVPAASRNKPDGAPRSRSRLKRRSSTGSCAPEVSKKESSKKEGGTTKSGGEDIITKSKSGTKGPKKKSSKSTNISNTAVATNAPASSSKRTSRETRRSKSTSSLTPYDSSKNKDKRDAGQPDSKQQQSQNSLLHSIPEKKLPKQTAASATTTKQRKPPRRSKSASASEEIETAIADKNGTTTEDVAAPPISMPMVQFIIAVDTAKTHGPRLTIVPGIELTELEEEEEGEIEVADKIRRSNILDKRARRNSAASTRDWSFRSVRTNAPVEEEVKDEQLKAKSHPSLKGAPHKSVSPSVPTPDTVSPTDSCPSPFPVDDHGYEPSQLQTVQERESPTFHESMEIRLGEAYIVVGSVKTQNSNSASDLSSTSRSQQQRKQMRHLHQHSFGSGDSSFSPPFASEDSDNQSTASSSVIQWWAAGISGRMYKAGVSASAAQNPSCAPSKAQLRQKAGSLFSMNDAFQQQQQQQHQQQQLRSEDGRQQRQPPRLGNLIATSSAPQGGSEFSVGTISTIGDGDGDDTIAGSEHLPPSNIDWMEESSSSSDESTSESYSDGDVEDVYVRDYVEQMQQQRKVSNTKAPVKSAPRPQEKKPGKAGKQKPSRYSSDNEDLQAFLNAGVEDDDDSHVSEYNMPPGYMVSKTDRVALMLESMKRQEKSQLSPRQEWLEPSTPVPTKLKKQDPKTPMGMGLQEMVDDGITPKIANINTGMSSRKLMEGMHESFTINFITDVALRGGGGGHDSLGASSLSASTITSFASEDFSMQSQRRAALMAIQKGIGGSVGSSMVSSFNHSLTSINEDHELTGEQMELLELGSKVSLRRRKRPNKKSEVDDSSPPKLPQQTPGSATAYKPNHQQKSSTSLVGTGDDDRDEEKENNTQDHLASNSGSLSGGSSGGDSGSFVHNGLTIEMRDFRGGDDESSGGHFSQLDFVSSSLAQARLADNKIVNEQEEERLVNALLSPRKPAPAARRGPVRRDKDAASDRLKKKLPGGNNARNAAERVEEEMPALDDLVESEVPKRRKELKGSSSSRRKQQQRVSSPPLPPPQEGKLGDQPGKKNSFSNEIFRSSQVEAFSPRDDIQRQKGKKRDARQSDASNPMDVLRKIRGGGRNLLAPEDMEDSINLWDGTDSVFSHHSY